MRIVRFRACTFCTLTIAQSGGDGGKSGGYDGRVFVGDSAGDRRRFGDGALTCAVMTCNGDDTINEWLA